MMNNKHVDFGFQKVAADEKMRKVYRVFESVADRYDLMNDLMSLGIHRLWKRYVLVTSRIRSGQCVLDLAAGTGDLSRQLSRMVGQKGKVVSCDINSAMLMVGRDRLIDQGIVSNVDYIQADAQLLPFPDDYFDCVLIAFGLRNVTDKNAALQSIFRVLKPGGRVIILEFSKPVIKGMRKIYDAYSFKLIPRLGRLVTNDGDSYQYLVESIKMHPDQRSLLKMMEDSGFEWCYYQNISGGIVAMHHGYKF